MYMINDDNKRHKIVQNTSLDEFELIDLPLEQLGDSVEGEYRCRNGSHYR